MTTMGQTLREAQRPTNSIVTPKDTLVMGHWNVRSLYRGGATAQVAREMEGYKLNILISLTPSRPSASEDCSGLDMSCCPWMKAGGDEKQRQIRNNLASHSGEGERQTRMEHMDTSTKGSKQSPTVEGRCSGLMRLLARRDLTLTIRWWRGGRHILLKLLCQGRRVCCHSPSPW